MSEAVDQIQLNIELKKLRAFFDSLSNIVMLEGDPLPNFAAANDTQSRMLKLTYEPTSEISIYKEVGVYQDQQVIDQWLLANFATFGLADTFYLSLNDFGRVSWFKVRVQGATKDWLLPLYHQLTSHWLQFAPLSPQSVYEFREREHTMATFIGQV